MILRNWRRLAGGIASSRKEGNSFSAQAWNSGASARSSRLLQ
jgi:hypothetical protein